MYGEKSRDGAMYFKSTIVKSQQMKNFVKDAK